jgi:hypothetical protein
MQNLQQWKMARSVAVFVIVVGFSVGFVSPTAQAQNYLFDRAGFATGNDSAGVIVADFNHDRRLDLAVTNFVDNIVSVLLGTRGEGFAAKVDYAAGLSPAALIAADFRGDGKVDLAVVVNDMTALETLAQSQSCWETVTAPSRLTSTIPSGTIP